MTDYAATEIIFTATDSQLRWFCSYLENGIGNVTIRFPVIPGAYDINTIAETKEGFYVHDKVDLKIKSLKFLD